MTTRETVYVVGANDLPTILGVSAVAFVVAMLAAVLARRFLRRAHYTLRTLPQWCAWRIQVEQPGPSARLVNTVRALIAAGVR